jgi:hypothetical protein
MPADIGCHLFRHKLRNPAPFRSQKAFILPSLRKNPAAVELGKLGGKKGGQGESPPCRASPLEENSIIAIFWHTLQERGMSAGTG